MPKNPKKITILQQTHTPPELMKNLHDPKKVLNDPHLLMAFEDVSKSQCMILQYLYQMAKNSKNFAVLMEGSAGISDTGQYEKGIKQIFDNQIPANCDKLSYQQSALLVGRLAAEIAAYLGIIKKVLPIYRNFEPLWSDFQDSSNKATSLLRTSSKALEGNRMLNKIHQIREFLALCQAWSLLQKKEVQEVVIVYGSMHTFDVRKCLPKQIEFDVIDFSTIKSLIGANLPGLSDDESSLLNQMWKDLTKVEINCGKLREFAQNSGYDYLFNKSKTFKESIPKAYDNDKHPIQEPMPKTYEIIFYDSAKTVGKSFFYMTIPGLTHTILIKKGCSPVQAKFISEMFKIVGLYFEFGKTVYITPLLTGVLQLAGLSYQQASMVTNIFMPNISAILFLPIMPARFIYKLAVTMICNLIGSYLGYKTIQYVKAKMLTENKEKKLTSTKLYKHKVFIPYFFDARSKKRIKKFLQNKPKSWSNDKTVRFIFDNTRYANGLLAGFISEMCNICCKRKRIKLQLNEDLLKKAGVKPKCNK